MASTLYDILHVPPTASAEEIRRAYRRWMKLLHPDTGAKPSAEQLQQIMHAYQVLSNSAHRKAYDQTLTAAADEHSVLTSLRKTLSQALQWFHSDTDGPQTSKQPPPSATSRTIRKKDPSFASSLSQAQSQKSQPAFVRGADGIYRRTGPQEEIHVDARPVRRPLDGRPTPLQKPGSWKLWR